jgi:EpsI family protein
MSADRSIARVLTISVCLVATAAVLARSVRAEPTPVRRPLEQCPIIIADYHGQPSQPFDERTLSILRTTDYVFRVYVSGHGVPVSLFVGYYASQREGQTIHSPQNCLPGAGWVPVSSGRADIVVPAALQDGKPTGEAQRAINVNRYVIEKGLDRQLVLYWYQSHGRVVASEYLAKLYLMLDAIRTSRTDGALVRIITPISTTESAAEREAVAFVQTIVPVLERHLPE